MKKKNNDYFELMEQQLSLSTKASALMLEIFDNYSPDRIVDDTKRMHDIEHDADMMQHATINKLSREFITPIEQEDIMQIVQMIDDVTDAIDEVIIDLYIFNIKEIPVPAKEMAVVVDKCVVALKTAIAEFRNFKKSQEIQGLLVSVNEIENNADSIYMQAIRGLFTADIDTKYCIGIKAIYDSLENCCDLCEHIADVIRKTIIKNM